MPTAEGQEEVIILDALACVPADHPLAITRDVLRLGVLRLAGSAMAAGCKVFSADGYQGHPKPQDAVDKLTSDTPPHALLVSFPYSEQDYAILNGAFDIIKTALGRGIPVVVGGNPLTLDHKNFMSAMAERCGDKVGNVVGVRGHGETKLTELLAQDPASWKDDPSLVRIADDILREGAPHQLTNAQFDALRQVETDGFQFVEGFRRSCQFACRYCVAHKIGAPVGGTVERSAAAFLEDLKSYILDYSFAIAITDSDLCASTDNLKALSGLINGDPNLKSACSYFSTVAETNAVLIPKILRDNLLDDLTNIGTRTLQIGVQSFSPSVLRTHGRALVDINAITNFIGVCRDRGIEVRLDFIWGLPGYAETDTCEDEVSNILRVTLAGARPTIEQYHDYPGSVDFGTHKVPDGMDDAGYHRLMRVVHYIRLFNVLNMSQEDRLKRHPLVTIAENDLFSDQTLQNLNPQRIARAHEDVNSLPMSDDIREQCHAVLDQLTFEKLKARAEIERHAADYFWRKVQNDINAARASNDELTLRMGASVFAYMREKYVHQLVKLLSLQSLEGEAKEE